jgi:orotidine-5'-phosphate decarboxylase
MDKLRGFGDRLAEAVRRRGNGVMVGLDPRLALLPEALQPDAASPREVAEAFRRFCCDVIDVVAPLVPIVKPQAAFFEEFGPAGMEALAEVIKYARHNDLLVVLDGKRNDIGSTAEAYARGYLGADSAWQADALTVSPYLGDDSLTPFVDVARTQGAGIFVLVKTSNPGGARWQDVRSEQGAIYQLVAEHVEALAAETVGDAGLGIVGAVVGATYPTQLAELRAAMPHAWLLVPGFGSQGGTARDVAAAFLETGLGAVVNNSRGILFAYQRSEYREIGTRDWQEAVAQATRDMIDQLAAETHAGRLRRN